MTSPKRMSLVRRAKVHPNLARGATSICSWVGPPVVRRWACTILCISWKKMKLPVAAQELLALLRSSSKNIPSTNHS